MLGTAVDDLDLPDGPAVLLVPVRLGDPPATGLRQCDLTGPLPTHRVPFCGRLGLRRAAERLGHWRLDGCTLVVTLEPCTMCAGALVLARVSTVVFGAWEPKTGAAGSLWDVLRDRRLNHRPEVYGGILEAETAAVLRAFFR
ncbi:nucleoside deaminase [Verrucosispora sioxanthis]|uniref:nucleoside deaminase n=1 Tax=Verrucosispora sioxanthis TaxID=2499994 RepID=UPI002814CC3F|nr:nucleoside deaminase [Verrucosispora sioxanthis]